MIVSFDHATFGMVVPTRNQFVPDALTTDKLSCPEFMETFQKDASKHGYNLKKVSNYITDQKLKLNYDDTTESNQVVTKRKTKVQKVQ